MNYKKKFNKEEATNKAEEFLAEVRKLEEKHSITFNSDTGDIYLTYKSSKEGLHWGAIKIGWAGDGTGLKVMEKTKEDKRQEALSKLSEEDKKVLGLSME